jgi:sugar phosphate isomerase/epimerase
MNRRGLLRSGMALAAAGMATPGLAIAGEQPKASAGKSRCHTGRKARQYDIGLVTYNLAPDWDLDTLITRCNELGIRAVEFRSTHAHNVEPELSKQQRRDVKQKCEDGNILIWGLGTACQYHEADPVKVKQNIERTKEFIGLAEDLGAKQIKVRPNGLPEDVPVEKTLEQIGKSLHTVGQAAADAGVQICCEMHGWGTWQPPNMHKIMTIADHPNVGVTWNSNPVDVKDGSIEWSFEMMRPWIFNVHITELINDYPWRQLFTLLIEAGYDKYTMIEILGLDSNHPKDTMRFAKYYIKLWDQLSRPIEMKSEQ